MSGRPATGAIVPERQRCICNDDLCLDHCRACNFSSRDLEEPCIADPDWTPDDDDLARREARVIPPDGHEFDDELRRSCGCTGRGGCNCGAPDERCATCSGRGVWMDEPCGDCAPFYCYPCARSDHDEHKLAWVPDVPCECPLCTRCTISYPHGPHVVDDGRLQIRCPGTDQIGES